MILKCLLFPIARISLVEGVSTSLKTPLQKIWKCCLSSNADLQTNEQGALRTGNMEGI